MARFTFQAEMHKMKKKIKFLLIGEAFIYHLEETF